MRGPGGLLPLGSAPWTAPVALLGHRDWDGLTGLTIAFHFGSASAHGGAGAAATVDMNSAFGARVGFLLQKGVKRSWMRSWAPAEVFPEPGAAGAMEHGMLRRLGRARAHAGHAAHLRTLHSPMWSISEEGWSMGSWECCCSAAHPELGTAASPEVPDNVGGNFTSIKWEFLLNPVGRQVTQAGGKFYAW